MVDPHLERMRAIVQSLPGTGEKTPWGTEPHFTVADKIFTGWGRDDDGGSSIGVKCSLELQAMLVSSDARFSVAPYVGKHGWVTFKMGTDPDWNEVDALVLGSYMLIAPKKLAAQVSGGQPAAAPKAAARKAPAKKAAPVKKKAAPAKKKPAATAKKPAAPTKKPAAPAKKKPAAPTKKTAAPAKKKPAARKPAGALRR